MTGSQRNSLEPIHHSTGPGAGHRWGLLLALQFLTILPIPALPEATGLLQSPGPDPDPDPIQNFDMSSALAWFPVVGAMLGAGLAIVDWILTPLLALPVRNAVLMGLAALFTGMLHLDGFVDCCDALLGVHSVQRRLEILSDSRVGAYGALGAALLLIARFAALGGLNGSLRGLALVAAPTLGRWGIVFAETRFPYARQHGLGSLFQRKASYLMAATATVLMSLALAVLVLGRGRLAQTAILMGLLVLAVLAVTVIGSAWASRRLGGGLTGDTYGALNELIELAVLVLVPPLAQLVAHVSSVVSAGGPA